MSFNERAARTSRPSAVSPPAPDSTDDAGSLGLRDMLLQARRMNLHERTRFFTEWVHGMRSRGDSLHLRPIDSPTDRVTLVGEHTSEEVRPMLMFGANSYLGLMTHPYIRQRMKEAIDEYGVGLSGSPLLNGRGRLHMALEERIADLKGKEDAVIFQSGYGANVGILSTLASRRDHIVCDKLSHASFMDGTRMSAARTLTFAHNDTAELAALLDTLDDAPGEAFVGVEGVYSMDGDLAPLDEIAALCREHDALLLVDDAHGMGVTGPNGAGTAAHFGVTDDVDLILSTFSKAFGIAGARVGYAAGDPEIIDYMLRTKSPYNLNSLSTAVAETVIDNYEAIASRVEFIVSERERIMSQFSDYCYPSEANFVLIDLDAGDYLRERGIAVRTFGGDLSDKIRVTVGKKDENDRLIEELTGYLNERS